jgi:hypothetical protein
MSYEVFFGAIKYFISFQDKDSAVLLGIQKRSHQFWPVQNLKDETDFPHRRAKDQWWLQMRKMMNMLVHHHNIEVKVEDSELEQEKTVEKGA